MIKYKPKRLDVYKRQVVESYHFDAFDVHQIKRDIDQYLNPKQDNKGYKAFEKLKRNVLQGGEMKNDIDLRSFRTLRDRSQIFLLIQKYFQVSSEFNQLLYDNLQLCRNTCLLYTSFKTNFCLISRQKIEPVSI